MPSLSLDDVPRGTQRVSHPFSNPGPTMGDSRVIADSRLVVSAYIPFSQMTDTVFSDLMSSEWQLSPKGLYSTEGDHIEWNNPANKACSHDANDIIGYVVRATDSELPGTPLPTRTPALSDTSSSASSGPMDEGPDCGYLPSETLSSLSSASSMTLPNETTMMQPDAPRVYDPMQPVRACSAESLGDFIPFVDVTPLYHHTSMSPQTDDLFGSPCKPTEADDNLLAYDLVIEPLKHSLGESGSNPSLKADECDEGYSTDVTYSASTTTVPELMAQLNLQHRDTPANSGALPSVDVRAFEGMTEQDIESLAKQGKTSFTRKTLYFAPLDEEVPQGVEAITAGKQNSLGGKSESGASASSLCEASYAEPHKRRLGFARKTKSFFAACKRAALKRFTRALFQKA